MRTVPAAPARGVTLIELIVTLAILAIIVALAAPSFAAIVRDNRIVNGTNQILGALQTARSEAVRRGHRVTVCVSTDQLTCADAANWDDGWVMFADVDGDSVLDDDEQILRVGNPQRGLRAEGNGQGARLISFNATGQPLQASTIGVCGSASAHTGRAIVISVAGRIRHDHAECEAPPPSSPDPDALAPYPDEG